MRRPDWAARYQYRNQFDNEQWPFPSSLSRIRSAGYWLGADLHTTGRRCITCNDYIPIGVSDMKWSAGRRNAVLSDCIRRLYVRLVNRRSCRVAGQWQGSMAFTVADGDPDIRIHIARSSRCREADDQRARVAVLGI